MTHPDDIDPNKMTSVEAAALYLSGGKTTDPVLATAMDEARDETMGLDAIQRSHLRRMMGFDFRMKMAPNKIHVSSKTPPFVTTHCKIKDGETDDYGNIIKEELIDRLVDACLRLKKKYEAEVEKNQ